MPLYLTYYMFFYLIVLFVWSSVPLRFFFRVIPSFSFCFGCPPLIVLTWFEVLVIHSLSGSLNSVGQQAGDVQIIVVVGSEGRPNC